MSRSQSWYASDGGVDKEKAIVSWWNVSKSKKEDKTVPTIRVSTIESSRRHLLGEGGSPWDTSKLVFDTLIWWWMW